MKTLISFTLFAVSASAADVSGTWVTTFHIFGDTDTVKITLADNGGKLTGSLNELKLEGTTSGDQIRFEAHRPNGELFGTFEGRIETDQMTGDALWFGKDKVTWTAKRFIVQNRTPQTHTFEPTVFHRRFSGTIEPALHIYPGDTVRTFTVDAGGRDSKGVRHSRGGNPETGPFFIEGAFPGDTLVVKFNRIRLNRDSAESGDRIVPRALDAGSNPKYQDHFNSEWKLDRESAYGSLAKPSEHLKNFKVKLEPMLGCVAVAPPDKQVFQAGWLGPWGGNMDYNRIREGVTVYLPIFQEGAILFVGDGHATEGDGELTGDALETSMDVEFTVNLIEGQRIRGPRAEDAEFIMASGIAGSLQEALQIATSQLAEWIERDYKLTPNESAIVLGSSIRYDIAELVDPQYHVVAKLSRQVLAQLK